MLAARRCSQYSLNGFSHKESTNKNTRVKDIIVGKGNEKARVPWPVLLRTSVGFVSLAFMRCNFCSLNTSEIFLVELAQGLRSLAFI
jgi:hypothetical protein